jgi:tetraacyldisaccharide 4'-kinase
MLYSQGVFRTHRLPVPVISVGNLTCGGTGKTPLAQWIARYLVELKKKVAILSRGYPGNGETSDESQALTECLPDVPYILGADRMKTGALAIEAFGAQCIVLDDGFQHLRVERNLNVVTIDTLNPFGFGYLLPRGLLREPVRAVARADVAVLTRVDQCAPGTVEELLGRVRRVKLSLLVAQSVHKPTGVIRWADNTDLGTDFLRGRKVLAFCGIGNPRSFALTLRDLGADVLGQEDFPDHHFYEESDLTALRSEARRLGVEAIVTTRKDAVKIGKGTDLGVPLLVLDVVLDVTEGRDGLEQAIRRACGVS